jgi:hypothetical protein
MSFCSFLPLPDDLWHKPHIYAWTGFFIGVAIGFPLMFWFENTRFNARIKAAFGNSVYLQATGAVTGGLGLIVGQIVALLVVAFCKG